MAATGGAANLVGIWYQTIGAAVSLIAPWTFTGAAGFVHGTRAGIALGADVKLLQEYFDMDTALCSDQGSVFIQFKVSTQNPPPAFGRDEVRDILRNATQSIISHELTNGGNPVVAYILASNRPGGDAVFALQETMKGLSAIEDGPTFLAQASCISAPAALFPNPKKGARNNAAGSAGGRTILDLARSISSGKAKDWGVTPNDCVAACLKTMAYFRFALARPADLEKALNQWLRTWGILPDEYDKFTKGILTQLQTQAMDGTAKDVLGVMRAVFDAGDARPVSPVDVWDAVVRDLHERKWPDLPTPNLLRVGSDGDWMLDRSTLLEDLPYLIADGDPTSPRIFAIVGTGGVGKTALMARLFNQVAGGVWDWESDGIRDPPAFVGYPLICDANSDPERDVGAALMRWGGRAQSYDQPVERLAHASKVGPKAAAVWLGFDGLDEISDLLSVARSLATCADRHPQVRLVLTCRPEEFDLIEKTLDSKSLVHPIRVSEFGAADAQEAVNRATGRELDWRRPSGSLEPAGRHKPSSIMLDELGPPDFVFGIRQPLFVGVLRAIYEKTDIAPIQHAYDGDPDAFRMVASDYMYVFCDRARRRIGAAYATGERIFNALRQLATIAKNPAEATRQHWETVCTNHLNDHVVWNQLHRQCVESGLIRELGGGAAGAFEWRHPFVGALLPNMDWRSGWL